MIEDKTRAPKPTPRDWAVFRYGLVAEALRPLSGEVVSHILSRVAARAHTLPDGSVRRFSVATLRAYLKSYQHEGLDGLLPKTRSDKGGFRAIDDDAAEAIARYRVQHRQLSVKLFHQVLHEDGALPGGVSVCEATLRRFLKSRGLDRPVRSAEKARAKYEMPHPNELWVADFCHGPKVCTASGKRRAILCAIIDDHSRVITGARFAHTEDTSDVLRTLRDAICTYGVPKRLYCDNGPAFIARLLREAAARIGCALLHSEPFDSPSRGKIERFFRTVRLRFFTAGSRSGRTRAPKAGGMGESPGNVGTHTPHRVHLTTLSNAYIERFMRSLKEECLDRMILFGEASLRRATNEFMDHYHRERNHQGMGNALLEPDLRPPTGEIGCRERLGGMLRYYHREAA